MNALYSKVFYDSSVQKIYSIQFEKITVNNDIVSTNSIY